MKFLTPRPINVCQSKEREIVLLGMIWVSYEKKPRNQLMSQYKEDIVYEVAWGVGQSLYIN